MVCGGHPPSGRERAPPAGAGPQQRSHHPGPCRPAGETAEQVGQPLGASPLPGPPRRMPPGRQQRFCLPAADGDHGVGIEAAVGPHRELSPGPGVAHTPHRLRQEVGGGASGAGAAFSEPGQQHFVGARGHAFWVRQCDSANLVDAGQGRRMWWVAP